MKPCYITSSEHKYRGLESTDKQIASFNAAVDENNRNSAETVLANALHVAITAVDINAVPVMSEDRHIPIRMQALLARQLFKSLGLKGISVTSGKSGHVRVDLPRRHDYVVGEGEIDHLNDPAFKANHEARRRMGAILLKAFPKHDDRSDSQSDYFDFCWSFS